MNQLSKFSVDMLEMKEGLPNILRYEVYTARVYLMRTALKYVVRGLRLWKQTGEASSDRAEWPTSTVDSVGGKVAKNLLRALILVQKEHFLVGA